MEISNSAIRFNELTFIILYSMHTNPYIIYWSAQKIIFWIFDCNSKNWVSNPLYVFKLFFYIASNCLCHINQLWNFVILFILTELHNLCRAHDFSFLFKIYFNEKIKNQQNTLNFNCRKNYTMNSVNLLTECM